MDNEMMERLLKDRNDAVSHYKSMKFLYDKLKHDYLEVHKELVEERNLRDKMAEDYQEILEENKTLRSYIHECEDELAEIISTLR